jgi:hypothetical protein
MNNFDRTHYTKIFSTEYVHMPDNDIENIYTLIKKETKIKVNPKNIFLKIYLTVMMM